MAEERFDEKHPFGKQATVVTQDNIAMASAARAARKAIAEGRATAEDHILVAERERLIKHAVEN